MAIISEAISLALSLAGNLFLGSMFVTALLHPENGDFMFRGGMLIYLVEFLSIHSSGMAFGLRKKEQGNGDSASVFFFSAHGAGKDFMRKNPKITLIFFYMIFIAAYGLMFKNWYVPFYFFISLITKFFGNKAFPKESRIGLPVLCFIGATLVAVFALPIFVKIFPIPTELFQHKIPGSSGLFVDFPQAVMVWGIVYFFCLSLAEVIFFLKDMRSKTAIPAIAAPK